MKTMSGGAGAAGLSRPAKAASMEDVARAAGVSMKTVSRVVNNEPNVALVTRERVLAAIADLEYRPSVSARALAAKSSFCIGLVQITPTGDYNAEIQYGAISACQQRGYHLILSRLEDYYQLSKRALARRVDELFDNPQPDYAILPPPFCDDEVIAARLRARGVGVVRISPKSLAADAASVSIDERAAAREMTRALIGLGHRRIAIVKGNPLHAATSARLDGFCEAMAAADLAVEEALVFDGDFYFLSGVAAGEAMFAMDAPPTAVFATNDEMAAGVSIAAHRAGLSIPCDVSIAGFDDTSTARLTWPALTTVRQPVREIAMRAALLAIDAKSAANEKDVVLDYELVMRESTGPAPEKT